MVKKEHFYYKGYRGMRFLVEIKGGLVDDWDQFQVFFPRKEGAVVFF
jgi:hypothetical protein